MGKLIRFVLVLAIGLALGYVFQPTIDTKLAKKSPKLKAWVMERQGDWNKNFDRIITPEDSKNPENDSIPE